MFAKIFGQIFDSSIAEDYNCRRMFMDLLVLADSDGVVDMTHEAIARRANVPIEQVRRYLSELCQPDPLSRSKMEEGRRLVPIDPNRDWGWLIVNYQHYRKVRDEEVRRSYFRDAQRKYRAAKKKQNVKDKVLTPVDNTGQMLTPSSASSSISSSLSERVRERFNEWIKLRKAMGKPVKNWDKMFAEQIDWLKQFNEEGQLEAISASIRNNWQGLHPPKLEKPTKKLTPEESADGYWVKPTWQTK